MPITVHNLSDKITLTIIIYNFHIFHTYDIAAGIKDKLLQAREAGFVQHVADCNVYNSKWPTSF